MDLSGPVLLQIVFLEISVSRFDFLVFPATRSQLLKRWWCGCFFRFGVEEHAKPRILSTLTPLFVLDVLFYIFFYIFSYFGWRMGTQMWPTGNSAAESDLSIGAVIINLRTLFFLRQCRCW